MAKFTTNLTVTTPTETVSASKSGDYREIFKVSQELHAGLNHNTFTEILQPMTTAVQSGIKDAKALMIRNIGRVGAEIQIESNEWADGSSTPDTVAGLSYQSYLLASGDFLFLPNLRQANFRTDVNSLGNGYTLNNKVPDANMYIAVDNSVGTAGGSGDPQLLATGGTLNATDTSFDVDDGDFFYAGDIIRLEDEVMEVTSKSSNTLTVIRGAYGSTGATHVDNTPLRFSFFNAYADFDKYSVAQSDASGRFKCSNFFGFARSEGVADGLVAGSVCGKFYQSGYQELGLSGITASTESGLTASTQYKLDITVDGGSLFQDLTFTLSSNTKFGGSDGVIRKIQDALDVQYYTAGNLFEKKVTVGMVNGDVRFTSGSHLSTSAILLADTGDSGSFIDAAANGRIPASDDIEDAVAARLPEDVVYDKATGVRSENLSALFYDDGKGNILGACSGTVNYKTGAIDLNGCPPNGEFVVSAAYGSAHSGENRYSVTDGNSISKISGRSANSKIYTTIEVVALQ